MKLFKIICCCILLLLTGCGFHLRGTGNVPPELHILDLAVQKPDAPFNQQLRSLLLSLQIHLTSTAPLTLDVNSVLKHSTPKITSSTQQVSFKYYFTVTAFIHDRNGKIIVPTHVFNLDQSIEINSSEIYTPNVGTLVEQQLQRDAITAIYFWLTNKNTKVALTTHGAVTNVQQPPPPVETPSPANTNNECPTCNSG